MQHTGIMRPLLRGDVCLTRLYPVEGSEKGKTRPTVIIQNDLGNEYGALTIVVPVSSIKGIQKKLPVMVNVQAGQGGLPADNFVDCGQMRTVDHGRLISKMGHLNANTMAEIDKAFKISIALS